MGGVFRSDLKVEIPHMAMSLSLSAPVPHSQSFKGNISLSSQPSCPNVFEEPVVTFRHDTVSGILLCGLETLLPLYRGGEKAQLA